MVIVHVGIVKLYEYNGRLFEYSRNKPFPPHPVRRDDHELFKRVGNKFWSDIEGFLELSPVEQEKYRYAKESE